MAKTLWENIEAKFDELKAALTSKPAADHSKTILDFRAELDNAKIHAKSGDCSACKGSGKMDGKECSECKGSGKATDAQTNLRAALETANGTILTLTDGKAAAEKSAKEEKDRANKTLAGQGIRAEELPAQEATAGVQPGGTRESAWDTYNRLVSEGKSREAGAFYMDNKDAIFKTRK